jgi:hypothetical protein
MNNMIFRLKRNKTKEERKDYKTLSSLFCPLSYVSCLLSLIFCLSSCEDILTVDSERYATVDENTLNSPNDSVLSVLGLLEGMQKVAERYVLFGEMRADLLDVNEFTPAAIRALSDFTVSETSDYANPRDYYDIINNCNYFISRTSGDDSPLKKENAVAHVIRAWTYMQVVFNWGKAYYFTEPLLSVSDTEKEYPVYTITQMIDALITDLEPFAEAEYPNYGTVYDFRSSQLFIPVKILLADLYLWRGASTGDYEQAATYYAEYIDANVTPVSISNQPSITWSYENFLQQNFDRAYPWDNWSPTTDAISSNRELITAIQMATSASEGLTSQLERMPYYFGISSVINDLWDDQIYVLHYTGGTTASNYYTMGDLRKQGNIESGLFYRIEDVRISVLHKIYNMQHFMLYRLGQIYLRYAEAVNRAGKPYTAFAVLKYGLGPNTFMDETKIPREERADNKPYVTVFNAEKYTYMTGIHARGCGDSAYDMYYTIGKNGADLLETRADTIQWIEDAICTELALETSFEGNRFQDLMRIAQRRNDPSFLAKRVAAKHENDYSRIYSLLTDTKNWFLPEKVNK